MFSRRTLLQAGVTVGAITMVAPNLAFAKAESDKKLFVIFLRGAVDGLSFIPPVGDPALARSRAVWMDELSGAHRLDTTFALHPGLGRIAKLYAQGDVIGTQAIATDYRERSHFDAQNLLETGGQRPFQVRDGWLNRFLGLFANGKPSALAIAPFVPLVLRGANPASSYAPSDIPDASQETVERIAALYAHDPQLRAAWNETVAIHARLQGGDTTELSGAAQTGQLAARLMAGGDGASIAMVDVPGWDSHANQIPQLNRRFAALDTLIGAFCDEIGAAWSDTLVLVATEFGRTVAINGTNGTDHGTGGAALLLGGGIKGGRVIADWPGLDQAALYEGRDLKPTQSLESLIGGALAEHFALDPDKTMAQLFPGRAKALTGLI